MVLFDLNKFKPINDKYGHHEGDFALTKFAEALQETFRESDVIGRLGGDEFVVMITDSNEDSLKNIMDRFAKAIETKNQEINKPYVIDYSAGVASFDHDTEKSLEEMIELADAKMYTQKKGEER